MSKIEAALAKARGRVVRLDVGEGASRSKDMVPLKEHLPAARSVDRAAAAKALAEMQEPWLLDATGLAERRIINPETADPEVVLVFRDLRTKILQVAQNNCSIMVTTVGKGDCGFVAANLATAFALDDSKTAVLVDCNLEEPLFNHLVDSTNAYGITDYLKNDALRLEEIMRPVGVRRLRVISAGRSHDQLAEYFTQGKMRELLSELRGRYPDRYIVLGAPPIGESANANILRDLADYAVLVVPYGAATESDINDAMKTIGAGKLLGVVFTEMPGLPRERRTFGGWLRLLLPFSSRRRYRSAKSR